MKRAGKLGLGLLLLFLLCVVGGYVVINANRHEILGKLGTEIENRTGYPLLMEVMPKVSLFPPGLEMDKTEWGDRQGDIFVSFSKASLKARGASLLAGHVDIRRVEFADLYVHIVQPEKKNGSAGGGQAPVVAAPSPAGSGKENVAGLERILDTMRDHLPETIILSDAAVHFVDHRHQATDLTNLNGTIVSRNGLSTITALSFSLLGSSVRGQANVDMGSKGSTDGIGLEADIDAPGLDLGQLALALAGRDLAAGKGDLKAHVAFNPLEPLPTFSGSGELSSSGITMKNSVLPPSLSGIKEVTDNSRLDSAHFQWTASQGIVQITRGEVRGPGFSLTCTGSLDLLEMTMNVSGNLDIQGLAVLPVSLQGPFHSPKYVVDQADAMDAVRQTLERHGVDVEDSINQGIDRLLRR